MPWGRICRANQESYEILQDTAQKIERKALLVSSLAQRVSPHPLCFLFSSDICSFFPEKRFPTRTYIFFFPW